MLSLSLPVYQSFAPVHKQNKKKTSSLPPVEVQVIWWWKLLSGECFVHSKFAINWLRLTKYGIKRLKEYREEWEICDHRCMMQSLGRILIEMVEKKNKIRQYIILEILKWKYIRVLFP